ncbi:hypothetical protein FRC17_007841 [Serendipita sp. 399]|nr:hypothetical protein FRC17_007841 [Serendipita sp. 399]
MEPLEASLIIETPSAVSSMDAKGSTVVLGCDDGTVRRYHLPEKRVRKAIMGLGASVSWLRFSSLKGQENSVWFSCGMNIFCFDLSSPTDLDNIFNHILRLSDAVLRISIEPEGEDDEINELAMKKDMMVFTTDSGRVGLVDLETQVVTFMRQVHRNVAMPISFVASRVSEICSGGYDNTLLHFDARTGSLLSHLDLVPTTSSEDSITPNLSLSPPFALSIAISSNDVIACSTASGHIWIGYGGSRSPTSSQAKRRSRKWEGLKVSSGLWVKAGNGPIVGVAFLHRDENTLLSLSLGGEVLCFEIPALWSAGAEATKLWSMSAQQVIKATTLVAEDDYVLICGVSSKAKGVMELLKLPSEPS